MLRSTEGPGTAGENYEYFHPARNLIRKPSLIADMIAIDIRPINIAASEGFIKLMEYLELGYHIPSRKHFTHVSYRQLWWKIMVYSLVIKIRSQISYKLFFPYI